MTSICLALNVRDAEQHIARCIKSALPYVDRAMIIDTGCTDNTMAIASEALGELPHEFFYSEWVGHAHNRTELLERAKESGAAYVLQLDADMEIVQEKPLRPLVKDEYLIPIRDRGLVYPLPLLTSTRKRFRYSGVAHAYLECLDPHTSEKLDDIVLIDHGGGGHREGKIERDAELLAQEVGKNPGDARSWFYLAQSYRDLGEYEKAIHAYKIRATLGGWSEEVYNALYQAGMLLCEHVNYYEGAKLLIAAAEMKQNRAEALRALAGCSTSVANKIRQPADELLFVEPGAYTAAPVEVTPVTSVAPAPLPVPPLPPVAPSSSRRKPRITKRHGLDRRDVSAIIVTRGNVDLDPTIEPIIEAGVTDIVVWNNKLTDPTWNGGPALVAKKAGPVTILGGADYKCFGRYAAIPYTKNPVLFWVDDDVIFREFESLLAIYEPGRLVSNMDPDWIRGAGYSYDQGPALVGAGSLCDAWLPAKVWNCYFAEYPFDDDVLVVGDHVMGTLAPFTIADLGYDVREFADAPDRLYLQPGQTERKFAMIHRARELLAREQAA